VQEVTTTLVADGFTAIECRGSPYYQHTALHPVSEWLQRCLQGDGNPPRASEACPPGGTRAAGPARWSRECAPTGRARAARPP
jgi:hypothetical protein